MKAIVEAHARGLKVPVISIKPEEAEAHFGWLACFAGHDMPSSEFPRAHGPRRPELCSSYIVDMISVPGTSLDESLSRGRQVTAALVKLPFVRLVGQRVGRAELADDTWGPHYSEIEVDLKPMSGEAEEAAQGQIRKTLAQLSGLSFSMETFLTESIQETISGYTASVVANIYGTDLDQLEQEAQQVTRVLNGVPGARDVQMQAPPGTPEIAVALNTPEIQHWGFDPVTVLEDVHTAYEGEQVGDVYEGNRVFGVDVILPPSLRSRVDAVSQLPLRNPEGIYVPLGQLASVYQTSGRFCRCSTVRIFTNSWES